MEDNFNMKILKNAKVQSLKGVHLQAHQKGVALLEALIALLIFSMGILALVGLQTAMISNTTGSKYRADASYLVQQRLSELWGDPANIAAKVEVDTDISTLLPNGKRSTTDLGGGQVRITVQWKAPGDNDEHKESLEARVIENS